jgi:hypothetical protein
LAGCQHPEGLRFFVDTLDAHEFPQPVIRLLIHRVSTETMNQYCRGLRLFVDALDLLHISKTSIDSFFTLRVEFMQWLSVWDKHTVSSSCLKSAYVAVSELFDMIFDQRLTHSHTISSLVKAYSRAHPTLRGAGPSSIWEPREILLCI